MAEQEKWELSREEIERRLLQLKQEKQEPTRGGQKSAQKFFRNFFIFLLTNENPHDILQM